MVPTAQDAYAAFCLREAVVMMKMCPLCHSEMPERYNYCYQCGEYVGDTAALKPALSPEAEAQQQQQERVIHYGCLTLIVLWIVFGLWFFFHMNR
jgi:predicted nucleic acid-binding Zn ribbon protein